MRKITIKFKELYSVFSSEKIDNELVKPNKKIFVKNSNGEFSEIRGLIKKTNQNIYKVVLDNGVEHMCADKHLFKTDNNEFKYSEDLKVVDKLLIYNSEPVNVKTSEYICNDDAYDISIDYPHEYVTPNGLIHHNTTTARIIVDTLIKNEMDVFLLNGSDSTGVDIMRNDIQGFLKSPPYQSKLKIVYIDEFDYTSSNAQAALRNIMEKYADNGRFIATCNYLSKIIDPLQSRFQIFEMKSISEQFAIEYCENILKKENIKYDYDTLKMIVHNYIPDVRKSVNMLQKNVVNGELKKIDINTIITSEKKVCGLIVQICDDIGTPKQDSTINSNIPQIMTLVQSDPDYRGMYQTLSNTENLHLWAKIKVNQYSNMHQSCAIPSIHFMAMVYDIISSGLNYQKLFKK